MDDGVEWPPGLSEAFWAYERALGENDLEALDRAFAPGGATLRGDAAGLLVGHEEISAFRTGRGGAPPRRLVETHVQLAGEDQALVVAVTELLRGGRGQQTQLWRRSATGEWQVTAAHVTVPAPALDTRVWRVVGDPLVSGAGSGPLRGQTVAVKDLYAVQGHRVGAGNPAWLAAAQPQPRTASAVQLLLDAGADVRGIARTDELAYSLAGTNAHYGTPPNPSASHRIPGGSSSGSAAAVALGHADIGLGTDTGGSIRVPASYQGLWGIRTTHGAIASDGLLPLAPTFDTVGWLTRSSELLARVGEVLLDDTDSSGGGELVVVPQLVALAEPDVAAAVRGWLDGRDVEVEDADLSSLPQWLAAFQTWQAWEAWQQHGVWLSGRMETLGPDVRGRFETASQVTAEEARRAHAVVRAAGTEIRDLVGDRVLVLPSAASVAPRLGVGLADRLQRVRTATMQLTCLAGLGGLPAVSVPVTTEAGLPCGVCLVAGPGRDRALLRAAVTLHGSRR